MRHVMIGQPRITDGEQERTTNCRLITGRNLLWTSDEKEHLMVPGVPLTAFGISARGCLLVMGECRSTSLSALPVTFSGFLQRTPWDPGTASVLFSGRYALTIGEFPRPGRRTGRPWRHGVRPGIRVFGVRFLARSPSMTAPGVARAVPSIPSSTKRRR